MTANTLDPSACALSREKARKAGKLRTAAKVLRLACKVPGLLALAAAGYRGFQKAYVSAAAAQGMPKEYARQIAGQMRPMELAKSFRKRNSRQGTH